MILKKVEMRRNDFVNGVVALCDLNLGGYMNAEGAEEVEDSGNDKDRGFDYFLTIVSYTILCLYIDPSMT
jgi:hypothetical protein